MLNPWRIRMFSLCICSICSGQPHTSMCINNNNIYDNICNACLICWTCGGQPGMRGSMRILVGGTRSISWWSSWWWWWRFKNDWLYEDYDIVKQWYWYSYDIVKQLLWSRHLWRRGDVWKGVHVPDGGVKTCARVVSSKELRLIFFILTGLA